MTIRINRVYTRSGDTGRTALIGGERVSKSDQRVEAYGELDELSAVLGCVHAFLPTKESTARLRLLLEELQQQLFDVGAELASVATTTVAPENATGPSDVKRLEQWCDEFGADLPELTSFILSGGSVIASLLHLARTVCRRTERSIVRIEQQFANALNPEIPKYINRLSDLLFILARSALRDERLEPPLWIPKQQRTKRI